MCRKALRLFRVNERLLRDEEDHLPNHRRFTNWTTGYEIVRTSIERSQWLAPGIDSDRISIEKYRTIDPCYYEGVEEEIDPTRSHEIAISC